MGSPFDLDDDRAYRRWRDARLATAARSADERVVELADPLHLSAAERDALLERVARTNMAVYRCAPDALDAAGVRALAAQLGMRRIDGHWLAEEDGVSRITVSDQRDGDGRGGFIPYTDRAIGWHTDGYYHPAGQRIRGMVLHCAQPAAEGGANRLLDHEIAYLLLRDQSPDHVRALMADDAMTIPERADAGGEVARPAQTGPVFSVDAGDGTLHMRYTARTRSIAWKDDAPTRAAVAALEAVLATAPQVLQVRMQAGMGLVAHNVLHDRSAFRDDPQRPRLVYRARFFDRVADAPLGAGSLAPPRRAEAC